MSSFLSNISGSKSAAAFLLLSQSLLEDEKESARTQQYELLSGIFPLTHRELDILSLILSQRWGLTELIQFAKEHKIHYADIWKAWDHLIALKYIHLLNPDEPGGKCREDHLLLNAIIRTQPIGELQDEMVSRELLFACSDLFTLCQPKQQKTPRLFCPDEEPEEEQRPSVSELINKVEECLHEYPSSPLSKKINNEVDGLNEGSRLLLYALTGWFYLHFFEPAEQTDFPGLLGEDFDFRLEHLMKRNLVVSCYVWDGSRDNSDTDHYRISPSFAEHFKGHEEIINVKFLSDAGTFTPAYEIKKKELFFNEGNLADIRRLSAATSTKEYNRIIQKLKERGLTPNLSAILYGPPGTGKTELARQIARETDRSLLVADLSKLEGIYVGESNIRYRNLFQAYRYTCALSRQCPILFLDEADGILGARLQNVTSSVGKHDNMNQNIILEEMNSLPGIIFATTNLISNIDEAMRRRFKMVLEFPLPDAPTRARLWASKYPTLSAAEAEEIGRRYAISGGIIDNIVSTAIMDEVLENRTIVFQDLVRYCEESTFCAPKRNKIGF